MKLILLLPIVLALTGCLSAETVKSASDEKICLMRLNFSARSEASSRGLDCDSINRTRKERENRELSAQIEAAGGAEAVLRDLQTIQKLQNMDRNNAAQEAQQMTILCGYCAKVYPQEIFGRCKGITQYSCGALWDDGKRYIAPEQKRSYRCRKIGQSINCDED